MPHMPDPVLAGWTLYANKPVMGMAMVHEENIRFRIRHYNTAYSNIDPKEKYHEKR